MLQCSKIMKLQTSGFAVPSARQHRAWRAFSHHIMTTGWGWIGGAGTVRFTETHGVTVYDRLIGQGHSDEEARHLVGCVLLRRCWHPERDQGIRPLPLPGGA